MRKTSGFSFTGPVRGPLAALDEAAVWLNSPPLTATSLRGRTVLVDFWTYSCVNWLRTLPYVRAWAQRYGEQGLVVIGAHAPEFGFEHDLDNVRWAIAELEVGYPVVIDNDFAIWRAFDNHYWPAIYLVDRDGRVRFHHFGEEAYAETERAVQQLLGVGDELARVDADGLAAAADWAALKSPETYVGYARGERRTEREPTELALNQWTLNGRWTVEEESAVLDGAGSIAYRFEGRDLNLVLAAAGDRGAAPFTILLDGELPGTDSGIDVDESGGGTVTAPRMYQLVRQHGSIRPRTFEMQFPDGGVRAYVFTFG
jgi:thiol-disulfide isomerase/thioredoxin